jgi:hypothetical protein
MGKPLNRNAIEYVQYTLQPGCEGRQIVYFLTFNEGDLTDLVNHIQKPCIRCREIFERVKDAELHREGAQDLMRKLGTTRQDLATITANFEKLQTALEPGGRA